MYANLYGDKDLDRRFAEGMMFVSVKEFQTYDVYISEDVKDSNERSYHAWFSLARFNPLHFINDSRYLKVDRTPQIL